jgi:hypothetical protein
MAKGTRGKMKTYRGTCTAEGMDWEVTVDGEPIKPRHDLRNHSPDGFAWGYGGSGPAQLALALLADLTDDETAQRHYQEFKWSFVAKLDGGSGWEATEAELLGVLKAVEARGQAK